MLDRVAANGAWLVLVFHKIVAGTPAATAEIKEEDFNTILAAIQAKDLTVQTVGEIVAADR
jgi:hypothetical protein